MQVMSRTLTGERRSHTYYTNTKHKKGILFEGHGGLIMNSTGIVRRIDDLGRVAIPKEVRRVLNLREDDPLEIFCDTTRKEVILRPYYQLPDYREMWEQLKKDHPTVKQWMEAIEEQHSL